MSKSGGFLTKRLANLANAPRSATERGMELLKNSREYLQSVGEKGRTVFRLPFAASGITVPGKRAQMYKQLLDPATSPIVGFMDDDITLYPGTCAQVCAVFDADSRRETGGVAVRIDEIQRPEPGAFSWWYYRLQAGYADRTYGGRLFGPAINCLPCYTEVEGDLIPSEWLNSGCVFYRTDLFLRELFPRFDGYSFMEDVHLSARIARTHRLYFHKTARCQHRDGAVSRPRNVTNIARMRIRNQRLVAREVLGLSGPAFEAKLLLHRLFASVSVLRQRAPGWRQELLGTWT